nr:hypothetical protein [Chloroflexota bacterium]
LGGATGVATGLPDGLAATLLDVARAAFVHGMQVVAVISVVVAVGVAIVAIVALRDVRPNDGEGIGDDTTDDDLERSTGSALAACASGAEG